MRSYEDRWAWLRTQLEDDAAVLDARAVEAVGDQHRNYLIQKRFGVLVALNHMGDADRLGGPNA